MESATPPRSAASSKRTLLVIAGAVGASVLVLCCCGVVGAAIFEDEERKRSAMPSTTVSTPPSAEGQWHGPSRKPSATPPTTISPTTNPSARTETPPTRAPAPVLLTNLGATVADWNAHHKADTRFEPGAAFDPNPVLARDGDSLHTSTRYSVIEMSGRIVSYGLRFKPATSVDAARAQLLRELPTDAVVAWFDVKPECARTFIKSATLRRLTDSQQGAMVGLYSGKAADHFNPRDVWTASLILIDESPELRAEFEC